MADRYWVGGAGTWDASSTTHWSASSGGASGASVPTAADNVFFDSASNATAYAVTLGSNFVGTASFSTITALTSTVTVAAVTSGSLAVGNLIVISVTLFRITSLGTGTGGVGTYNCSVLRGNNNSGGATQSAYSPAPICADISFSGPTAGTLTWVTTSSAIEVAGGVTVAASGVTMSPILIYTGSGTHTITTNSVSMAASYLAGTGTYTLGSAYTTAGSLYFCLGTFTTANFALTVFVFDQDSATTRTINLGSSTVTINSTSYPVGSGNPSSVFGTNVTFNAGTSQVNFTGTSCFYFSFGLNKTWYNVSLTNTSVNNSTTGGIQLGYGATDTPTFNNFSIAGQAITNTGVAQITLLTSMTINGTFTIGAAASVITRLMLKSNAIGTARTITAAAFAAGATDIDWMDITIAGAAGTISGTRFGNCGGCTNITFDAAKTVYWNLAGAQNWSATAWATSSGGSPAVNNFPLAQDTAVFDNTGSVTGTITINASGTNQGWNIGTLDMSARTSAMTLAASSSTSYPWIFGSWINGSGVTISGVTGVITFSNRSTKTINSAGKTFTQPITIDAPGGGLQLLTNNLTVDTTVTTTLTSGTLDLNNLTLSTGFFSTSSTNIRTLAFGTGNITCTGNSAIFPVTNFGITTNLTITGTPVCNITTTSSLTVLIALGTFTSTNAISFNFTGGTYTLDWTYPGYPGTYKNLNFTGFSGTLATRSTQATIYGNLTLSSTMTVSGYTGTITFGATSGTQTITTNSVTVAFPIVVNAAGTTITTVGAFTSSSSWTISDSSSTFFPGGTFTVSTFSSASAGQQGFSQNYVITGSGSAYTQSVVRTSASFNATSYISMTSASPKTFAGGGSAFAGLNQGGTGTLTITGSNTFYNAGISNTVQPATILITAGTTQTVGILNLNGTSGNLVTLDSTSASAFTVTKMDAGVSTATYCSVSYMTGTTTAYFGGTVLWRFLNSTNGGNNTNLTFASIYYWVGGSGTWNNSSTTNWSLTSGGAGAQGPPTSADDVYFDTASNATAYTVTMGTSAACFNMNMSGPTTGQVTWAGSTAMSVYGSFTLSGTATNGGVSATYSGTVTFAGTYTGLTVTTNGVSCAFSPTFNGVGGAWTLGGAFTTSSVFILTNGTFSTSTSNYAMSVNSLTMNSAGTRTLSLNGSTITTTQSGGGISVAATGVTINAGTSQINIGSNIDSSYTFGAYTYYNVSLTGTSATTHQLLGSGTTTFNTLTVAGPASTGLKTLVLSGNITATNLNLNTTGTYTLRLFVRSDTLGTQRTITWISTSASNYCDFRDINSTLSVSGTGGDCGGNSGMTFSSGKTVYWNLAGAQNWSATGWAATSGAAPAAANFPLAQDTAVFDNTGSVTGTITVNLAWNIGAIDMSGRTSAMTLDTSTNTPTVYGSWTNGSGTTLSGTGTLTFSNRSTKTINSAGKTFTQDIVIDAPGGGIQLLTNNLTTTGTSLLTGLTRGTLDLNNLTFTVPYFSSNNTNTRAIAFGTTGNITVSSIGVSGTVFDMSNATGFTYTGTPTVNMLGDGANSKYASLGQTGGTETNALSFIYSGTAVAGVYGVCKNLDLSACTAGATYTNQTLTVYGNLTFSSAVTVVASGFTMTFGATSGTKTITTATKTLDFPITFNGVGGTWSLQDALTMGSTRTMTLTNGTLNLNGQTVTVGTAFTTATGTKNLTFNGGTLVCPTAAATAFNNAVPTGFSTTAGTGTGYISMTAATAKTFVGGGTTYNCVLQQAGAGALTITGSNSFADIQATSRPSTIIFPASVTTTVSAFTASGTAGNLLTLQSSSSGSQFTLSKSSGTVQVGYLSIQDSNATGGAQWRAGTTSTIVSNVSGWLLLGPPTQIRASINSSGVLYVPNFNQLDEVSKSINSVGSNALYSNLFDETQTLSYNGIPVAQRKTADGKLLVSGYFDETTLQ